MIKTKRLIWLISIIFIVLFCGTGLFFIIDYTKSAGYTLTLDLNGGIYNNSTQITYSGENGSFVNLPVPERAGFKFVGWMPTSCNAYSYMNQGKMVNCSTNTEPTFNNGSVLKVYNNAGNGTVTHKLMHTSLVHSPYNKQWLRISNTGEARPGQGGFSFQNNAYANAVFYVVIQARFPKGYTINFGTNDVGNNNSRGWLTDNTGTGDFKTYVHYIKCGASGTFATTNFFYFNGAYGTAEAPINFDISSVVLFDATGYGTNPDTFVETMKQSNYYFGTASQTLIALWEKDSWLDYADTSWVGSGTESDPYLISSAEELAGLSKNVNNGSYYWGDYFEQTTNIDLSEHIWFPIGQLGAIFEGNFNGNGYSINGMHAYYDNNDGAYLGLFGLVWDATIENIRLNNSVLETRGIIAGGLIGQAEHSVVRNCYVDCRVICTVNEEVNSSRLFLGGAIGWVGGYNEASATEVDGITSVGTIECLSGENFKWVGGVVGVGFYSTIKNSKFGGVINATTHDIGGIIGYSAYMTISSCYVNGKIFGEAVNVGAVVGYDDYSVYSKIIVENAVVIGDCTSSWNGWNYGLFAGVAVGSQIDNCSIKGTIEGSFNVGSLIGETHYAETKITNCSVYAVGMKNIASCCASSYNDGTISIDNSYFWVKNKKVYYGSDFSAFAVMQSMNYGLPIQRELFSVASVAPETDVVEYLESLGFSSGV